MTTDEERARAWLDDNVGGDYLADVAALVALLSDVRREERERCIAVSVDVRQMMREKRAAEAEPVAFDLDARTVTFRYPTEAAARRSRLAALGYDMTPVRQMVPEKPAPHLTGAEMEQDSPPFTPAALDDLAARGYVRTGRNIVVGGYAPGNETPNARVVTLEVGPPLQFKMSDEDAADFEKASREDAEMFALRHNLAGVSGALCDAATVHVCDDDYGKSIRLLTAERDALRRVADASAPCTCGSGGHPRECAKHPLAKELHCAEMSLENVTTERDLLEVENVALCRVADAARALMRESEHTRAYTALSAAEADLRAALDAMGGET